jgi:outer membrane protein OmpA-like peptidoglycan-associated protein
VPAPVAPPPPAEEPPAAAAPVPAAPAPPALALTIHFNTGEFALNPRARAAISAVAEKVAAQPGWRLAVEGHADSRGDAALNARLSQQRARVVSELLEKLGLSVERVQTAAFGDSRPLSSGDDPAALRRNRRVEVLILRGEP